MKYKAFRISILTLVILYLSIKDQWSIIVYGVIGVLVFYYPKLRKIKYLKSVVIGICWILLCCIIPILGQSGGSVSILYIIRSIFLFILIQILMLAIDMRHRESDNRHNIRTLAHDFEGNKGILNIVFGSMLLGVAVTMFFIKSYFITGIFHIVMLLYSYGQVYIQSRKTEKTDVSIDIFGIDIVLVLCGVVNLMIRLVFEP